MASTTGRFPSTLTILPTYNCTAACEHCCFGSHPGIAERIPLPRILDYITQAAGLGTVKVIVFSGGECFTLGPELVIAIAKATELGLATRCVTNGCWAISEAHGRAAGPAGGAPACKRSTSARAISISALLPPPRS